MDKSFIGALLRLKTALNAATDKEVAKALGMTQTAFNSRKTRGAFPVDRLRLLAGERPELGIDVEYVLSGQESGGQLGQAAQQVAARRGKFAPPLNPKALQRVLEVVSAEALAAGVELDAAGLAAVAGGVYNMLPPTGEPNAKMAQALLAAYLAGRPK